jgi:hypothetical protein
LCAVLARRVIPVSLRNQRKVIRIGIDGSITTYRLDDDDSVHPIVTLKLDGSVVKAFTMVARNLASLLKGALQVVIMPPETNKKKKKPTRTKKKHTKITPRKKP